MQLAIMSEHILGMNERARESEEQIRSFERSQVLAACYPSEGIRLRFCSAHKCMFEVSYSYPSEIFLRLCRAHRCAGDIA